MTLRHAAHAAILALALATGVRSVVADDAAPAAAAFAPVVRAWQSRDAKAVTALILADGRLSLSLEGYGAGRIVGRPTKENAQAILKGYFEKIESASLKDATAPEAKTFTRQYDYTYRPRGADERTTRLSFTLQKADDASFALIAAEERPKKQ